ncbi:hypothetical protein B0H10DRAFT_1946701, partial [Mycena sp. CBHHK59/15]
LALWSARWTSVLADARAAAAQQQPLAPSQQIAHESKAVMAFKQSVNSLMRRSRGIQRLKHNVLAVAWGLAFLLLGFTTVTDESLMQFFQWYTSKSSILISESELRETVKNVNSGDFLKPIELALTISPFVALATQLGLASRAMPRDFRMSEHWTALGNLRHSSEVFAPTERECWCPLFDIATLRHHDVSERIREFLQSPRYSVFPFSVDFTSDAAGYVADPATLPDMYTLEPDVDPDDECLVPSSKHVAVCPPVHTARATPMGPTPTGATPTGMGMGGWDGDGDGVGDGEGSVNKDGRENGKGKGVERTDRTLRSQAKAQADQEKAAGDDADGEDEQDMEQGKAPPKKQRTRYKQPKTPLMVVPEMWDDANRHYFPVHGSVSLLEALLSQDVDLQLDLEGERPRSNDTVDIHVYWTGGEGEPIVLHRNFNGFANSVSLPHVANFILTASEDTHDHAVLRDLLAHQWLDTDGRPLFLLPIAQDPNPRLRPSKDVSMLLRTTPAAFARLSRREQQEVQRHRCILFEHVQREEPAPAFDYATFSEFRDPEELCEIQGTARIASGMAVSAISSTTKTIAFSMRCKTRSPVGALTFLPLGGTAHAFTRSLPCSHVIS